MCDASTCEAQPKTMCCVELAVVSRACNAVGVWENGQCTINEFASFFLTPCEDDSKHNEANSLTLEDIRQLAKDGLEA